MGMLFSAVLLSALLLISSLSLTRVRFISAIPVNRSSIHRAHFALLYGCALIAGLIFVIPSLFIPNLVVEESVFGGMNAECFFPGSSFVRSPEYVDYETLSWGHFYFALLLLFMLLFMCMLGELLYTLFPRWLVIVVFIAVLVSPFYDAGEKMVQQWPRTELYYSPLETLGIFFFQCELFLWPPLIAGIIGTQVLSERRFIRTEIR